VVYDVSGREVKRLVDGRMPAGNHTVNLDARSLPSGVYFYQLKTTGNKMQREMILLK